MRLWDGDPNGRHVARYLLWDGDALLAEFDANGQRQVDYAYLPGTIDHPFAHTLGVTAPTEVRYHELDELGNVIGTSASGTVSQSNTYDAWGTVTYGGNADQHLTWKGLFWNGDITGLYFMRNRWYDPDGGRFMNEDPAGFSGGINLYAFSGNDPVNGRDASGLNALAQCEQLMMFQMGDEIRYYWEDSVCPAAVGGEFIPDDPPQPPTSDMPGSGRSPHGGGAGGPGTTKPSPRPISQGASCGAAVASFMVSGALDAFTLVGATGIFVRAAIGYRAGTRMVTISLSNPYARQNSLAVLRAGLSDLRTLGIGPGGAFPTSAAAGVFGQVITGSGFNLGDYLPFIATLRAYKTMNAACP